MEINQLIERNYQNNRTNGFFNKYEPVPYGTLIALVTTELSESIEAHRSAQYANVPEFLAKSDGMEEGSAEWQAVFESLIKDKLEDEIADTIIRLLDLVKRYDIDIEFHIDKKLTYNSTRKFKHGKNY